MEVIIRYTKRALQNHLEPVNYNEAMMAELEELDEVRLSVLDYLVVQKNRAARAYDKRVKAKSFSVGDLVWKTILPIGEKILDIESSLLIRKAHSSPSKY